MPGGARMTTQPADASDLIDRLVRSGLGQGEARCYVGMLAPRAFRVGEVAKRASLPRSRCYELIRSLVRSGLCTEVVSSRAARFRAVPPNEAIGRLEALAGEQARQRNAALGSALRALEGRAARRAERHDPARSGSLLIRHAGLAELLHEAFEHLWQRGQPTGGTGTPAAGTAAPHPDDAASTHATQAGEAAPGERVRPVRFPRPG